MDFECTVGELSWMMEVDVIQIEDYQIELVVSGKGSRFHILIGIYVHGGFLCIPSLGIGCELSCYTDKFWNRESIGRHLNEYDTEMLVCAIAQFR